MSDIIMIKPDELSGNTLRKAISAVKGAYKATTKASFEASMYWNYSWGGNTYYLFSDDAHTNVLGAENTLKAAIERLEELSRIMKSGPDGLKKIDQSFKTDIKKWRKSRKHNQILWQSSGGSGTVEETVVGTEEILLDIPDNTRTAQKNGYDCAATAYAIGLSIVTKEAHDSSKYFYNGYAHYDDGGIVIQPDGNSETTYVYSSVIYEHLKEGKPTAIHYGHDAPGGEHYVLVVGIRAGADPNNLTLSDFIIVDPADGRTKPWDEAYPGDNSMEPWGMIEFK